MINGVLIEKTVKDVIPALTTNSEGLKQVLRGLIKQYNDQQTELDTWKVCHQVENLHYSQKADSVLQKKNNIQIVQQ